MDFSHFDEQGNAWMVDVGGKEETKREATARGSIFMSPECLKMVKEGSMKKGDALCHLLNLTKLTVDFTIHEETNEIEAVCTARTTGRTGVEMEALAGVNVALLTIYDMCKAVDKSMEMSHIYLEHKSGGKSGEFYNEVRRQR